MLAPPPLWSFISPTVRVMNQNVGQIVSLLWTKPALSSLSSEDKSQRLPPACESVGGRGGGVCPLPPHLHPTSPCLSHASPHVVKHTCNTLHSEASASARPAPGTHFSRIPSSHASSPRVRLCPEVSFCHFLRIPPYLFIYLS